MHDDDSKEVARALSNLGEVLKENEELEEAVTVLEEALASHRRTGDEVFMGMTLDHLAHVAVARRDFAGARVYLEESLDVARNLYHENHPKLGYALYQYSWITERTQGRREAVPLKREMLRIYRKAYGNEHPEVADALNSLGVTLMRLGEFAEAETLLLESLAIRQASLGNDSEPAAASHENLGELYRRMERFDEAEQMLRASYSVRRKMLGETHDTTARVVWMRSKVYCDSGKYDLAEESLLGLLSAQRKEPAGLKKLQIAVGEETLGVVYMDTERLAEAEPLLLESYATFREIQGTSHFDTVRTTRELVKLYGLMDNEREAAKWRAKLGDIQPNP